MRDSQTRAGLARAALAAAGIELGVTLEITAAAAAGRDRRGRRPGRVGGGRGRLLLEPGDVVVIAHKAVAKAEGRVVDLAEVVPSPRAIELAGEDGDPRQLELVLRESRRIVRRRGSLVIAETHHGFVCASAGIDRSNAPGPDMAVLLPVDPDGRRTAVRESLRAQTGRRLAVIVADTMGRPLRNGIVGTAIGVSGLAPLHGLQGEPDPNGYVLRTTQVAVADELAAAADLVMGKLERAPAALIRGFEARGEGSARRADPRARARPLHLTRPARRASSGVSTSSASPGRSTSDPPSGLRPRPGCGAAAALADSPKFGCSAVAGATSRALVPPSWARATTTPRAGRRRAAPASRLRSPAAGRRPGRAPRPAPARVRPARAPARCSMPGRRHLGGRCPRSVARSPAPRV